MAGSRPIWPPLIFERIFTILGIILAVFVLALFIQSIPLLIIAICLVAFALRILPFYLLVKARSIFRRHFRTDQAPPENDWKL